MFKELNEFCLSVYLLIYFIGNNTEPFVLNRILLSESDSNCQILTVKSRTWLGVHFFSLLIEIFLGKNIFIKQFSENNRLLY